MKDGGGREKLDWCFYFWLLCEKKLRLLLDLNKKLNQVGDYQDFL